MTICDVCKKGEPSVSHYNVSLIGLGNAVPAASLDLCKGCAPIFKEKLLTLVRETVRAKR